MTNDVAARDIGSPPAKIAINENSLSPTPPSLLDHLYGAGIDTSEYDSSSDEWNARWTRVVRLSRKQYDLPGGAVGREFVEMLTAEVNSLAAGHTSSERVMSSCPLLLQRDAAVHKACDIRRLLKRRFALWKSDEFDALLQEAERCDASFTRYCSKRKLCGNEDEHAIKIFTKLMLQGKVRDAVRWITKRNSTDVLLPQATLECGEVRRTVFDILQEKHPAASHPSEAALLPLPPDGLPILIDVDITSSHVERAARSLRGGSGPSGTDSLHWQDFLLHHGPQSEHLRDAVASFARRLSNSIVEWNEVRALMANRLIALDKNPGVRPIGIGECLRRILGKCLAIATGEDVETQCGTKQLCSGLKAGIEGAVHAMRDLYNANVDSGWGLLLVDASNAFNSINRIAALWNARIQWPRCARFLFNTYRGFSALILQGSDEFLYSREGVTQGDPLSMMLYALAVLPLIDFLEMSEITQNWYADDASAIGPLSRLREWLQLLIQRGPSFGYFPEPQKSYLVVSAENRSAAEAAFDGLGVKIVDGQRFLGGYIGSDEGRDIYVAKKIQDWCGFVDVLSRVATQQPQAAFSALARSLQNEWGYLQRVIPDCGDLFRPLESALAENFLPALFGDTVTAEERTLFTLPANHGGLGIPDPTQSAQIAFNASLAMTQTIGDSIKRQRVFHVADHKRHLAQTRNATKSLKLESDKVSFGVLIGSFPRHRRRAIEQLPIQKTSAWLTALPLKRNHFDLSPGEFRDALAVRYRRPLLRMPSTCDGCGQQFNLVHALDCKKGGLVTRRHNEVRDALADMASLVWSDVVREPVVRDASVVNDEPALIADLGVRGVWEPQTDALFDVRVLDTDAPSYGSRSISSILSTAENEKKRKYREACDNRRASFTPLVMSVDGILAKEAQIFLSRTAECLSERWQKPYGMVMGWVRARLSFAVLRATHLCLRGSRVKWRSLGVFDGATLRCAAANGLEKF
jgi:hypothetical protein